MRALDDQVRLARSSTWASLTPPLGGGPDADPGRRPGWSTFAGLQVEYSLVQREVERALIPMARGLADIARGTGAY